MGTRTITAMTVLAVAVLVTMKMISIRAVAMEDHLVFKVGFSATVPHAVDGVKARAHYVTETPGGWGAVREVADAIRKAQGLDTK